MADIRGRDVTLRIGDGAGPEVFTIIARAQAHTFTVGNTEVEINTKDGGGWRELFTPGASKSVSLNMTGVYIFDATQDRLKDVAFDADPSANFQIVPGDGERYIGKFQVSNFETSGETEGVAGFSATFSSSGPITVEADV